MKTPNIQFYITPKVKPKLYFKIHEDFQIHAGQGKLSANSRKKPEFLIKSFFLRTYPRPCHHPSPGPSPHPRPRPGPRMRGEEHLQ